MSGVLVVAETRAGELRDVTFELLTAARELAEQGAGPIRACIVGAENEPATEALRREGVEEVLVVASPRQHFEAKLQATAVEAVISELRPAVVLVGHTVDSMGFAPAVAAAAKLGFASDAQSLAWSDGSLVVRRGSYGDRLAATLELPQSEPAIVTVRPGVFAADQRPHAPVPVRSVAAGLESVAATAAHVGFVEAEVGDVDITAAEFLLSIGRGVEGEEGVERMLELADAIGATLSASRPLIDAGLLPAARQVGQSGRTVKPKVYLAFGISGSVQHLMGMRDAETIIAVNTDHDAPIFGVAHYGAVADLEDVGEALAACFDRH